jgi:hypothetical protein
MIDEIAEDEEEDGYGDERTNARHSKHETTYKLSPPQPSISSGH